MFIIFQSQPYFDWMIRLLGFSLLIQSIELLRLKVLWGDAGLFSWTLLRRNFHWFRMPLDFLFKEKVFRILILLSTLSAASFLLFGLNWLIIYSLIFICLLFVRLGGSFNGGSDAMTALVVAACAARMVFPESEKITKFCIWYLALQIVLSYFVAGLVKVKNPDWRSGRALKDILFKSNYVVPTRVMTLVSKPTVSILACWGILLFECLFPLALMNLHFATVFVGLAAVFHLANFYLLGLNRFVWAWVAAYPALLCVVSLKL